MELLVFSIFIIVLFTSVISNISVIFPLIIGYLLFSSYGLHKNFTVSNLLKMSFKGIKKVKDVLLVFILIGMITAVWRAAGTIPMIIYTSSKLITPSIFILMTFLLNALVSVLIGTALGTSATMGVICMMIGNITGANPVFVGGAVLSGIYFGDRCSPMATSAILTSVITKTNLFENIKKMIKTSIIPFIITCIFYLLLGILDANSFSSLEILEVFNESFNLTWISIIPAILVLILALFNLNIKYIMIISILSASLVCFIIQDMSLALILKTMVVGFKSTNLELSYMINGGGILSMLRVFAIVTISSTYSVIFEETGLLNKPKEYVALICKKFNPFFSVLITSIFTSIISCNQTLAIMLTQQLCEDIVKDKEELAITLSNTAVVIPALIPWSIAAAVPLTTIGAPTSALLAALYLYLLPIYNLTISSFSYNKSEIENKIGVLD